MSTTIVSSAELKAHLSDSGWCVIDCRHDLMDVGLGRRQYDEGHIPGAQFAHMDTDLSGAKTGRNGRHPLPLREDLSARFRAWGINNDTQLVAYDAAGGSFAARLWWLARWLGHDRVALLDGGWPAWMQQTGLSTMEPPARPPGRFAAGPSLETSVDASQIVAQLGSRQRLLVDARARERYEGRVEPLDPVAGHIPGALHRFWQDNLINERFKAPEQLRTEFEQLLAGRRPEQMVAHCGSGVTACHHLLAMRIAGLPGAQIYAGSWSEWVADPARPVAIGAQP